MKYLCLIYSDETMWPKMPKADTDKMISEYREFGDGIKKSGHYVDGNPLKDISAVENVSAVFLKGERVARTRLLE